MLDTIYMTYGKNAETMTRALLEKAEAAKAVPAGANVCLKPNLVVAKAPDSGATTHAGVLAGAIGYFYDCGIKDVSVIEGSWVGDSTRRAFVAAGYDEVARRFGVKLYDLKADETRAIETKIGPIKVCRRALEAGFLINLPVLKGHCQTVMTCAMKNLKGCIPDSEKRRFHSLGLIKPIAALAAALTPRPHLTIVDGICGDLSFEEGGTPVPGNRMYLGRDVVALDALGCTLMGIETSDVPYIALAESWGAGLQDVKEIIEIGDPREAGALPAKSGTVARLTRNVTQKDACSACYAGVVHALYRLDEQGLLARAPKIAVGQGMKGVPFDGIGSGRCCDCAKIKVPGCPPKASDILAALLDNLR